MLSTSDTATCCYFTISPPKYDHFSTETPACSPTFSPLETPADPTHPLLAYRQPTYSSLPTSTDLLQVQTMAAHGHSSFSSSSSSPSPPHRPRPHPIQNVLHVTSDDSDDSSASSSSSSVDLARCSRCQRTSSIDVQTGKSNMIRYGLNLWYCLRCASIVGLKR